MKRVFVPEYGFYVTFCLCKKGKGVCIAIYGNPSHNYGVSLGV